MLLTLPPTCENPPGDGSLHGGSKQFQKWQNQESSPSADDNQEVGLLEKLKFSLRSNRDLLDIFLNPKRQLPDLDVRRLYKKGVSLDDIDPIDGLPLAAKAEVRMGAKLWEPFPKGKEALLFIETQEGLAVDIIAFDGERMAMLTGRAPILGLDAILGWPDHAKPLRVFDNPVEWLANNCEGVVIVDEDRAWRLLWNFESFEVSDVQAAARLKKALTPPNRDVTITIVDLEASP